MEMNYGNPGNRIRAAEMLRKLLPRATKLRESHKDGEASMEAVSSIGQASLKWYRTENCTGVYIYQGEKGGWFADLSFKDLPAGVPVVIGTPNVAPNRTREDAIESAVHMLALLMNSPTPQVNPEEAEVVFEFDNLGLIIPSAAIAAINKLSVERPSNEYVEQRLDEIREQFAGGKPFNSEIMDSLSEEDRRVVYTVCVMALALGMPRYPKSEEVEAPPFKSDMH